MCHMEKICRSQRGAVSPTFKGSFYMGPAFEAMGGNCREMNMWINGLVQTFETWRR